jgi:zinc transport system permease protein
MPALTGVAIGILLGEPYTGLWQPVRLLPAVRHPAQLPAQPHRAVAGHLIGVFLSVSLALGASLLLMLAGKINVHILENVLFGSVLTVSAQDLLVLGIVALLVLAWRCRCTTASCWPASTRSWRRCAGGGEDPGLPVRGAGDLVTVASVKVIGAILVGALLVIPAAAARLVSQSLKGFFFVSVLIATISTLLGILLPIVFDLPVPSGAAIILVAGICFALAAWPAPSSPACKETRHEPETLTLGGLAGLPSLFLPRKC